MRKVYCGLAGLMLAAVVAQFSFAAVGAFTKPGGDDAYILHSVTGMMVIPVLSVLATVVAALARAPGRMIGLTILPFGLVLVQMLIIGVGSALSDSDAGDRTTPAALVVLSLHGINGLVIMGVAGRIFAGAMRLVRTERTGSAAGADSATGTPVALDRATRS